MQQDTSSIRVLVRAPLEAMRDIDFPLRAGTPYLDLVRADSLLRQAAETWIVQSFRAYEGGNEIPGTLGAVRISQPSDKSFAAINEARRRLAAPPLDRATDLPWQSALVDAEIVYPVRQPSAVSLEPTLARLGVRTTTVMTFIAADGTERTLEYVGDPGRVRMNPRWYDASWQFITLGFHHILDGIDHLLFVLCLVLPFRKLKPLIGIVTAFTVAHSITLIASSLGWAPDALWFPPLVEVLIAASIAWMALENIVTASRGGQANVERRWLMAFAFGLIHGFGFAFALRESLQFAGSHLALALVSFNVGVELGQIAVLVAALPLLSLLYRRVVSERTGIIIISAFVTHTAWHWLGDRWSALRQYSIDLSLAGLLPLIRVTAAVAIGVGIAAIVGRLIRMRGSRIPGDAV